MREQEIFSPRHFPPIGDSALLSYYEDLLFVVETFDHRNGTITTKAVKILKFTELCENIAKFS